MSCLLKPLDLDYLLGVVWPVSWLSIAVLDFVNIFHSFDDLSKYGMITVKPWRGDGGQEELGATSVGTSIGHREEPWSIVALC